VSYLHGHRPEAPDPSNNRWLTARPAVLAKRSEPDRHTSRPMLDGPGRTLSKRRLPYLLSFPRPKT